MWCVHLSGEARSWQSALEPKIADLYRYFMRAARGMEDPEGFAQDCMGAIAIYVGKRWKQGEGVRFWPASWFRKVRAGQSLGNDWGKGHYRDAFKEAQHVCHENIPQREREGMIDRVAYRIAVSELLPTAKKTHAFWRNHGSIRATAAALRCSEERVRAVLHLLYRKLTGYRGAIAYKPLEQGTITTCLRFAEGRVYVQKYRVGRNAKRQDQGTA